MPGLTGLKPEIPVGKSNCSPHAFGKLQKIWAVPRENELDHSLLAVLFFKCSADFDILLRRCPGGVHLGILGGSVPPGSQILTLFQTKKRNFPHPFSDHNSKIHTRYVFRPEL